MTGTHLAEVERTLLLIAEARERAERAAREIRRNNGEPPLVKALGEAERSLLAAHGQLMRSAFLGASEDAERQLRLASGG